MWRCNCWNVGCSKSCFKKKLEKHNKLIADDDIAKNNALIRFYFKCDPDKLTDTDWCKRVSEIEYVLKKTGVLIEKNEWEFKI